LQRYTPLIYLYNFSPHVQWPYFCCCGGGGILDIYIMFQMIKPSSLEQIIMLERWYSRTQLTSRLSKYLVLIRVFIWKSKLRVLGYIQQQNNTHTNMAAG
jgi:hypothetical protein